MVLIVSLLGGGAALEMRRRRKKQQLIEEDKLTENLEKQIESLQEDIQAERDLRKQAEDRVEELCTEKTELCKENKRLSQQNAQLKISGSYLRRKTKHLENNQTQHKSQTQRLQNSVRQLEQKNKEKDKELQELTVNLKAAFQSFRKGKISQQKLLEKLNELGVEVQADEQDLKQQLLKDDCVELNIDDNWQHKLRFSLDLPDRIQRLAMTARQQSLPPSFKSNSPPPANQEQENIQNQNQINQNTKLINDSSNANNNNNNSEVFSEEVSNTKNLQTQVKNILNQSSPNKTCFDARSFEEKLADYQRRKSFNNTLDKHNTNKSHQDSQNENINIKNQNQNYAKNSSKTKFSNKNKQSENPTPVHSSFEASSQMDIDKIRQRSKQLRQKLIQNQSLKIEKSAEYMYDNAGGDSFGSYLGKWMKMVDTKSPQKNQSPRNQVNFPTSQFGSFQIKDFDAGEQQSKQVQRSNSMQ